MCYNYVTVAEKIIEDITGHPENHETFGTEEYLDPDIDNSIQEISDDYSDQIQADPETITVDFEENILRNEQDNKNTFIHKYSNIRIDIDEIESDNYQEDDLDDIERIPDKDISNYEAVIEEYPDYANLSIKEEVEPFPGTDYTDFDAGPIEEHNNDDLPPEDIYHYNNVIILGSKPCQSTSNVILRRLLNERDSIEDKNQIKKENLKAVVILEDWGANLENSDSFCNSCGTLFVTPNDLDAHKMIAHSFLVPVNKNVAVKSTTKPAFARKSTGTMFVVGNKNIARKSTGSKAMFCNHCNKVFPDNTTLIKHLYELLPLKQFGCSTCNIVFQTQNDLTEHNIVHVKPEEVRVKKEKTDKKGAVLKKKVLYQDVKKYTPLSLKGDLEAIPKSVLFQCPKCGLHFVIASYGYRHYLNCDRSTGLKKPFACDICKRKIHTKDLDIHKKQHKICTKFRVFKVNKDLCEKVLCKCPNCDLYFGEYAMITHLKDCGKIKPMRCQKCNLLMSRTRFYSHMRVHKQLNLKLKDFLIIHYSFQRPTVKRKMEPLQTPTKKIKLEDSHSLKTNIKQVKKEPTMKMCAEEKPVQIMDRRMFEKKGSKFRLFTCTACKGCCYLNSDRDIHLKKQCVSRNAYTKVICPECGLQFTRSMIKHHRYRQHKEQLTIHNIAFFDIRTLERTVPCIPDYPQCSNCKIKFFEARVLAEHICGEDYETCNVCGNNYHSSAYDKHVDFHKLILAEKPAKNATKLIPELMKKYKSLNKMWNIVYCCKTCDIITDQYDKAVEHSQGHYNQELSTTNIKCYICNLKFDETCWSKHSELHSRMNINSTDFNILTYNPRKLLTEEWFELFQSLPKEQIRQVTDKSVYGYERRFQMKLLKEGRTEFTVYCCRDCNVACRNNEIEKHINSVCRDSTNVCQVCSIPFSDISTLKNHQILHLKGIKKEEFRVVSFAKQQATKKAKQQTKTKVTRKIKHKTKQKPSYKTKQEATFKTKQKSKLLTKNNVKITINKLGNMYYRGIKMDSNGKYLLYKCKNCHSCIHIERNIQKHYCHTKHHAMKCKHCSVLVYVKNMSLHVKRHKERPDFNEKNFIINLFDPPNNAPGSKDEFEPVKKRRKTPSPPSKKVKNKLNKTVSTVKEVNNSATVKVSPTKSKADTSNVSSSSKVPVIYKCDCGLHYTSLQNIEKHIQTCDTDSDISKEHCSKCGLLFPTDVLVSHLCKHHSKNSKFNVELYHKEPNIDNVESTSESPIPLKKAQIDCKVKLYKCKECNIHFVNQNTCYKHTYKNHQAICQRYCIECRLCGLQFTLNTLTVHVNRHHSAEISLDDILVEEYWPVVGKGQLKRELYIASEKVQSFQVTSSVDEQ